MISHVIASGSEAIRRSMEAALDCVIASAPRNDARGLVLAMHLHPSRGHASNKKPRKFLALRTDLRQKAQAVGPVPSRSMLQATNVRARRKRKAERRRTLIRILRTFWVRLALCKGRSPIGVPPRFSPKGVIVPKAQLQARLPGTWSERALPAFACPSPASTSRPGHNAGRLMPKPPGSGSDEPPPAGTASRSDQPGSPADVLHGERD